MTTTIVGEELDHLLEQWPDEPAASCTPTTPEPLHWTTDGTAECPLAHDASAPGAARHLIHTLLAGLDIPDEVIDSALLITSELVTNAVEHAQAPLTLHLRSQPTVRQIWIGVTDGGPATVEGPWARSCAPEEHGRGRRIITTLAHAHGHRTHDNGQATHWARLTTT